MLRNVCTKLLAVCMIITCTLSAFTGRAHASANATTANMVTFFRDSRTNLNTDMVSRDEIIVFGVFLTNFLMPGQTTLADIKDASLAQRISTKFFGSTGKSEQVQRINQKVYDAIYSGMSTDAFKLYKDEARKVQLTGSDLFNLLYQDKKLIYTSMGQGSSTDDGIIDLNDPVMEAVIKVLYGYSPDLILGDTVGLRGLGGLFIDGFGNIWGNPVKTSTGQSLGGSVIDNYVLVLPACLNPLTFARGNKNLRFPVTNAFVMGATPIVDSQLLANASPFTPYYSVKEYFRMSTAVGNKDITNMLSIFGVSSPFAPVGNSERLFKDTVNKHDMVQRFMEAPPLSLNKNSAAIVVAIDTGQYPGLSRLYHNVSLELENKHRLAAYLNSSVTVPLDQVADDMYYFNFSGGASNDSGVKWDSHDDNIIKQALFTTNDRREFFANSYVASPYVTLYQRYRSGETSVLSDFLKTEVHQNMLKQFIETGIFGGATGDDLTGMFIRATGSNSLVYGFLPAPNYKALEVQQFSFWDRTLKKIAHYLVFGLTQNDVSIAVMSGLHHNPTLTLLGSALTSYSHGKFHGTVRGGMLASSPFSESDKVILANLFHNFNTYKLFSMNSTVAKQLRGVAQGTVIETNRGNLRVSTMLANDVNNWPGIYWGCMTQLLAMTKADGTWTSSSYSNTSLPPLTIITLGGPFNLNAARQENRVMSNQRATEEEMKKDTLRRVYGLLSDEPNSYRDKLLKATQDSWVITTHRAITGSWADNILSVSSGNPNAYASIVGYINTPHLYEIPFTSWILDNYMQVYVIVMSLMFVSLMLMVIANVRTGREAILALMVLSVALILPQTLINNTIRLSNSAGDRIYSNRFDYWAILQHQQSLHNVANSLSASNPADVNIARNFESAKNVYSTDVGVRVKWMSPKKSDVFDAIFTKSATKGFTTNFSVFRWLFNSFAFQEEYIYSNPLATYLYRPYNAIASDAESSYNRLRREAIRVEEPIDTIQSKLNVTLNVPEFRFGIWSGQKVTLPPNQETVAVAVKPISGISDDAAYRYWPLNSRSVTDAIFRNSYEKSPAAGLDAGATLQGDPFGQSFLLHTESPFYYFYNSLKYRYSGVNGGFKSALLTPEVFKATGTSSKADHKMRDFLDMEGLFTYIIPYLRQSNEYVYGWTSVYGQKVQGYDFSHGDEQGAEFKAAQLHKEALKRVWTLYSPWVDSIYDLDVHNQRVALARKRVLVADTLNPGAYDAVGRPMIWSEADMYAKGYTVAELSDIEYRIQRVLETTYKDLLYLVNYHDFDDEVVLNAAAMMATFNFNREFSQNKIIGESVALYPQGFELKNFNYDAFLRMAMLNATGEPLLAEKDLYVRILEKTSIFTGLFIIANDILAVLFIPTLKMVVILLLLVLGILICMSCVITPPERMVSSIGKAVVAPAVMFLVFNVAFAYLISLFVGSGLVHYVGAQTPVITTNDPSTTLLLMIAVGVLYSLGLLYIVRILLSSISRYAVNTGFGAVALLAGAGMVLQTRFKGALENAGISLPAAPSAGYSSDIRTSTPSRVDTHSSINKGSVQSDKLDIITPTDRMTRYPAPPAMGDESKSKSKSVDDIRREKADADFYAEIERLCSTYKEPPKRTKK